jgi:hypothetical protein
MGRFVPIRKIFREHPIKITLASFCIISFIGLNFWDYYAPLSVHNWNEKEISKIKVANVDDFAFAVFGDNKGNYSIFKPLLYDIAQNSEMVFAIDVGDLVDRGTRRAYRRFLKQVEENVEIPFLTAIGNHDLNNGSDNNYREIFGPTYYAFQVGKNYFIVLDATTESGFDRGELQWLQNELKKAQPFKNRFIFMHVPPFDPRGGGFKKCLKDGKDLLDLFRRYKVTHLFAGHIHGYFSGVWEGFTYTITGGAGGRLQGSDPEHFFHHYVQVNVRDDKIDMKVRRIDADDIMASFIDLMEDNALELGLLLSAGISLFNLGLSMRSRHGS